MKFTEIKEKEALRFINEKQYQQILDNTASHGTKFNLWMGLCETKNISPIEVTLPKFYES